MKIRPEHYTHMKAAILRRAALVSLADYRALLAADPRVKDLEMRLRWDLLHQSLGSRWICDELYPYANDEHIDTALRTIMRELFGATEYLLIKRGALL